MKTLFFGAFFTTSALAADLKPNAKLTFDFPELPNTLAGMVSGTTKVARLGAILPSNYAPSSKHPLFVYIKGGSGGPEDGGAMARDIVGAEYFIAVQVPLFKKNQPKGKTLPVMVEDLAVVSAAYRTMLEKLAAEVPNIDGSTASSAGTRMARTRSACCLRVAMSSSRSTFTRSGCMRAAFSSCPQPCRSKTAASCCSWRMTQ